MFFFDVYNHSKKKSKSNASMCVVTVVEIFT